MSRATAVIHAASKGRALSKTAGVSLVAALAWLSTEAPARADVAIPGYHIVPSEVVFTGLHDFPNYRFVIAVSSLRPEPGSRPEDAVPAPVSVREGEPVRTGSPFFQELRALPKDTPDPVTDEWVLASKTPTSSIFTRHPYRAPDGSDEQRSRARFHVRGVHDHWISLELLSNEVLLGDGSARPISKVIPVSWAIESFEAPSGWNLFLMTDPSSPSTAPTFPPQELDAGDVLPPSVALRMLVAVKGSDPPQGSPDSPLHYRLKRPLDPWARDEVPPNSRAVENRQLFYVEVTPEGALSLSGGDRYRDADNNWFEDAELELPSASRARYQRWLAPGATVFAALILIAVGAILQRRRTRAAKGNADNL